MTDQFSEAVAFGEMVLRHLVHERKLRKTEMEPSEVMFRLALPVLNGIDERGQFLKCADGALIWLVERAESDRGAFDLARHILASRLFRNEPLPDKAREYAGLYIAGLIEPPKKLKAAKTFTTNLMLYWTAKRIEQELGLKLTRGDENIAKFSACDAVSDALGKLGHGKTYRAIKELCYNKSSEKMRQMAHQCLEVMTKAGTENPEMLVYWQSQAPWDSVTEQKPTSPSRLRRV